MVYTLARWEENFYPRSPCGERLSTWAYQTVRVDFYPRSPCGERLHYVFPRPFPQYFYPRSPCGERHYEFVLDDFLSMISTHALHAESDGSVANSSRLPTFISTHALHAESDNTGRNLPNGVHHFYPRSPCGERLQNKPIWNRCVGISTHALHAESDFMHQYNIDLHKIFLPTLSMRRAT